MARFQIYVDGHRGLIAVVEAKSYREALTDYFNETAWKGSTKVIRNNLLTVKNKNGTQRRYKAVKV